MQPFDVIKPAQFVNRYPRLGLLSLCLLAADTCDGPIPLVCLMPHPLGGGQTPHQPVHEARVKRPLAKHSREQLMCQTLRFVFL